MEGNNVKCLCFLQQLRNGIGNKRELVLKLTRVEKQDHRAIMKTYHLKSLILGRDCVVSLTSGQAQVWANITSTVSLLTVAVCLEFN